MTFPISLNESVWPLLPPLAGDIIIVPSSLAKNLGWKNTFIFVDDFAGMFIAFDLDEKTLFVLMNLTL